MMEPDNVRKEDGQLCLGHIRLEESMPVKSK